MRTVLPAALLVLALASAALPAGAPPGAAAAPPAPASPASPAFSTGSISRIRSIAGDAFSFECDDRRIVTVRLAPADCRAAGAGAVESATAVATGLLQTGPVWVFPCGQAKGASGDEVWADVWTAKGWLSDILIRAGYAKRRAEADAAALTPLEKPCASSTGLPLPPAPAFAAASCASTEGDVLQVVHKGRMLTLYLTDVTCQGLDSAKRDAATATATRMLQAGPFWVFPCPAMKGAGPDCLRARVWTQRGWLSDALLQEGSAKRAEEGDPRGTPAAASPAAAATPGPAAAPQPPAAADHAKPGSNQVKWREIQVSATNVQPMSCQSSHFRIEVPQWRLSWNLTPWRVGSPTSLSVCRVVETVASGGTSMHVGSFRGLSGSTIIRAQPGTFWVQITGSGKLDIKVEVPE